MSAAQSRNVFPSSTMESVALSLTPFVSCASSCVVRPRTKRSLALISFSLCMRSAGRLSVWPSVALTVIFSLRLSPSAVHALRR